LPTKVPPYAVMVGDYPMPKPIAGHPALEFCNTWAGWGEPDIPGAEWLRDYDRFVVWARFSGLITPNAAEQLRGRTATAVMTRARALRGALYRMLRHGDDSGFGVLAAEADEANLRTRLTGSGASARFALVESGDPVLPLHAVALSAVDLLGRPERERVRACPGGGCGWLFLDPRGRRVWCNMAVCGNRAKVRTHASRHK
jgi:predicted RNA-binding Zn ribbon-like protein